MKPLNGLLVVALEQAVAAPYCSSRLADAGARVIKIERVEGDFARHYDHVVQGESAYFVWLNRGKESVCLNIKEEGDRRLLLSMLDKADVFIQNLAPGACARAGFDSQQLRKRNKKLITVDISGYGESGPYRDMKAYDLLVQCETGLTAITGARDEPGRVGVSVCDIACGMYSHTAILEALIERSISGVGKGIQVSLFDALADWMTVPLLYQEYGGEAPKRAGLNHPSIAPYGAYTCGDGHQVVISIQNHREWRSFCEVVLQMPEMVEHHLFRENVDRCENRPALDKRINEVFGHRKRTEVIEFLKAGKVAFGSLNSVADLSRHPQLRRMEVETPAGPVQLVCPPALAVGEAADEATRFGRVPTLGEHSDAIRNEFR
ncbi:MAG: CoA transferase [Gammaproteobacteria bacterium]|nr:MAG: CoA transferase [Gammaproteobacteria bacterium]